MLTPVAVKELAEIKDNGTPDGIALMTADSMSEWVFTIAVLGDETVYRVRSLHAYLSCGHDGGIGATLLTSLQGEQFALRLKFGDRYPIESPEVSTDVPLDIESLSNTYLGPIVTLPLCMDVLAATARVLGPSAAPAQDVR